MIWKHWTKSHSTWDKTSQPCLMFKSSKPIDNFASCEISCKPKGNWNFRWSALFVNSPHCWLWEGVKWLRFKIKLGVFSDKILFKCITSTPGWLLWLGGMMTWWKQKSCLLSRWSPERRWRQSDVTTSTSTETPGSGESATTRVPALRIYAKQTTLPLSSLRRCPNFTSIYCGLMA